MCPKCPDSLLCKSDLPKTHVPRNIHPKYYNPCFANVFRTPNVIPLCDPQAFFAVASRKLREVLNFYTEPFSAPAQTRLFLALGEGCPKDTMLAVSSAKGSTFQQKASHTGCLRSYSVVGQSEIGIWKQNSREGGEGVAF